MTQLDAFRQYTLDKSAQVPLYFQVKNLLTDMLDHGELNPGDMIPTELELCTIFNISRTTIRQALTELVEADVFYRVKGRGTFVSQSKVHHNMSLEKLLFSNNIYSRGFIPTTKVLDIRTISSTPEISTALKIPVNTDVISLKRLKYANDEPLLLCQTYLPYSLCKTLYEHNLNEESLTDLLSHHIHTKLAKTLYTLQAVTTTKEDCELLMITKITAIQLVHSVGYNKFETPIKYSICRYRGDKNTFGIEQKYES